MRDADLLLATDPDADRVGAVVRHQGLMHHLSGNQIAALLADHIFSSIPLSERSACLKSIVTSELVRKIAAHYGVACFDLLPGFKYVAEKIREWEDDHSQEFVFAAEESSGYLYGTQGRDKDALVASLLIAECALGAKLRGETLIDTLHRLYQKHGFFFEKQHTLSFKDSKEGQEKMKAIMEKIVTSPPLKLHGKEAIRLGNLQEGFFVDLKSGKREQSPFPKTNMVILYYEGGQTLMIRPSGTEPKIKIYLMLQNAMSSETIFEEVLCHLHCR
jgi:phosphomannomutase